MLLKIAAKYVITKKTSDQVLAQGFRVNVFRGFELVFMSIYVDVVQSLVLHPLILSVERIYLI